MESQFRSASDWANNTGQGVDNPGDFQAAINKRCPLYELLEPIMGDRPNAKPLATNEEFEFDSDESVVSHVADAAAVHSVNNAPDGEQSHVTPHRLGTTANEIQKAHSTGSLSSKSMSSSAKRLTATQGNTRKPKKTKGNSTDDLIASYLGETGQSNYELREREVAAREQEASARMLEAQTTSEKSK